VQRRYAKLCVIYVHNLVSRSLRLRHLAVVVEQTITIELNILIVGGEYTALQDLVDGSASQIARGLRIWQRVESLEILVFGLLRLRLWWVLYVVVFAVHRKRLSQDVI